MHVSAGVLVSEASNRVMLAMTVGNSTGVAEDESVIAIWV